MHCLGSDYARGMPPVRRTAQRTVAVDDELWHDCMAIAKARRQKLSEVLRAALVDYRAANLGLLMQIKDATPRDPS